MTISQSHLFTRSCCRAHFTQEEVALHDGVYVATLGPVFETPAEINAFRILV